jgi:uncharacterized protein YacL (UPF0231 family)
MKYIGLDGHEYATVADLTDANKKVKEHPLYLKEMRRRAVANIPGAITREEWQKLWTSTYLESFKKHDAVLPENKGIHKVAEEFSEKVRKKSKFETQVEEALKKSEEKKSAKADKRKYSMLLPEEYRRLLKRANAKKMEFDLTEEQVSSLLEKKCHFCGVDSETIITVGNKFDYPNARPVCGTCKRVHDVLGDEMQEYVDRLIQD